MVKKARQSFTFISLLFFVVFFGCSTIPMEEGSQGTSEITVEYHLSGEGLSDGLGVKLSWDIIENVMRYRVLFTSGTTTVFDTVYSAFEIDTISGDTVYNNFYDDENENVLGTYKVYFSTSSSGAVADTLGTVESSNKNGNTCLVSYDCNGGFAMYWDANDLTIIGRGDSSLHTLAEIYLYDPCDTATRIDTTFYSVDTTIVSIDTTIDTTVVPPDTTIDTTYAYNTTVVIDSATAYLIINSGSFPPFSGSQQSGILNAGSDSSFDEMVLARDGADYTGSALLSANDILWMQSADGRYCKIEVDSMYISPVTSDLDTAIIYFKWRYQPIPNFRLVN